MLAYEQQQKLHCIVSVPGSVKEERLDSKLAVIINDRRNRL